MPTTIRALGKTLGAEHFRRMQESSPSEPVEQLRERLKRDGYLLLRKALDPEQVAEARMEILKALDSVDEIDRSRPLSDGVAANRSSRDELPDKIAWWKSVCEGPALRKVTHAGRMVQLFESLLGEPVRPFDFLWLRATPPGRATGAHVDNVFMSRGSDRLLTCWTPLGDVPIELGPLLVLEGSNHLDQLAEYHAMDVDNTRDGGIYSWDPPEVAERFGLRWVTHDFEAGDVVILTMLTMHGSLDNQSNEGKLRISSDIRYQPAADPIDERWVGDNPEGHRGTGYSPMAGWNPPKEPDKT